MTEILQGDVKVPGLGKTKKVWVYGGLGLAGAYVAYRWWAASVSDEPSGPQADYEVAGVGDGIGVVTGGTDGTAGSGNNNTETDGRNTDTIDNNAEWTQKAAEILSNAGYDPATVYAALGEFLARRSLDAMEASIARAAIAAVGHPPIGGPYSVLEAGAPTVPGSPSPTTLPAPKNLRAWDKTTTTQIGMQWDPVEGASHYRIFRTDLGLEPIGDSLDTKFWSRGLSPGTSYSYTVAAMSTTNKTGTMSGVYTARTAAQAPKPAPKPPVGKPKTGIPPYTQVIAKRGDSISKIAARYGKSWQTVWNFNLKYRSKTTAAILRARGPHKIFSGTRIWIPR